MRTIIILCAFLLLIAPSAMSQETSSAAKVGIGVSIEPFRLIPVSSAFVSLAVTPIAISVPIEVSGGTRVEPEVGIFLFSSESGGTTRTSTFYRFGAGVFFPVVKSEHTSVYVGPKAGLFLTSSKTSSSFSTSETSETDFFIAGNVGGEYAVSGAFRVFGEAQLYYLSYGKPTYTPAPPSSSDRSQSVIFTNIVMGMRFYF